MSGEAGEPAWSHVDEYTHVLRLEGFGVNAGLVIGRQRAAVIDSGAGPVEASELYAAVRELTDLPLVLINTHAHGDHFFGNAYFRAQGVHDIWAHAAAAATIASPGADQRDLVSRVDPAMAAARGPHTTIVAPNRTVGNEPVKLDLGGAVIVLFHLGPAHTDGDLLVGSGSALFAGDLVEEGAPPQFEDSFPRSWARALERIIAHAERYPIVVPGHGQPVGVDFVRSQWRELRASIDTSLAAFETPPADIARVIASLPYGPEQSLHFFERLRDTAGSPGE